LLEVNGEMEMEENNNLQEDEVEPESTTLASIPFTETEEYSDPTMFGSRALGYVIFAIAIVIMLIVAAMTSLWCRR